MRGTPFTEKKFNEIKTVLGMGISVKEVAKVFKYATGTIHNLNKMSNWAEYLVYKEGLKANMEKLKAVTPEVASIPSNLFEVVDPRKEHVMSIVNQFLDGVSGSVLAKQGDYNYRLRVVRAVMAGETTFKNSPNSKVFNIPSYYVEVVKDLKDRGITSIPLREAGMKSVTQEPVIAEQVTTVAKNSTEGIFQALDGLLEAIDSYVTDEVAQRTEVYKSKLQEAESEIVQKAVESDKDFQQKAKNANWRDWLSKKFLVGEVR